MKGIIINHFFNYEFVYIFLFCSIIFLITAIFVKQKILKFLSISLFSILFMFFVFELFLSFVMTPACIEELNYKSIIMNGIDGNIHIIKEIKYFDKNNKKHQRRLEEQNFNIKDYTDCKFIFNKDYSLYSNGFRTTKCNNKSDDVFLFFGGSFTFGDGSNDNETLPYKFSELFDFKKNVINCGISAKSLNTALNILNNEVFLPLIKNKDSKIKYCFYSLIGDHIYRNFRFEGGCFDGYLYKNNKFYVPTIIGKIKCFFARSYIFRKVFVPLADTYFLWYYENYLIENLKGMNKLIEEKYNSKLTIIIWPALYSEHFRNNLERANLDVIFLSEKFDSIEEGYKIKYDGHPTAKANQEIAEILYKHINEKEK